MNPPLSIPGKASWWLSGVQSATTSSPSAKLRMCRPLELAGPHPKQMLWGANDSWRLWLKVLSQGGHSHIITVGCSRPPLKPPSLRALCLEELEFQALGRDVCEVHDGGGVDAHGDGDRLRDLL